MKPFFSLIFLVGLVYTNQNYTRTHPDSYNKDRNSNKRGKDINQEMTSIKGQESANHNKIESLSNSNDILSVVSAGSTILVAGLGDKSFIITTIMATKYSKLLVFISASVALIIMGYLSVEMGLTIPHYISSYWIDVTAVIVFLVMGLKMIVDGLKMSEDENNEKNIETFNEINSDSNNLAIIALKSANVQNEDNTDSIKESFNCVIQTFVLVFISEVGDKTQISTIYLSANYNSFIIFYSVSGAQILLTLLAVIAGSLVSGRISIKTLTVIAGAIFLAFGIISLFLLFMRNYVFISKSLSKCVLAMNGDIINPARESLRRRYLR